VTYLVIGLSSKTKSGTLTVIAYQLNISIVIVGQADNEMDNT
jgi:hypothetical protein